MKKLLASIVSVFSIGCVSTDPNSVTLSSPKNEAILGYQFLAEMYEDKYFPNFLVDKGRDILLKLCLEIESQQPESDEDVYRLTHKATESFNQLAMEFYENDSEIETAARDAIGTDFDFILTTYGFNLDVEEAIAPRDW